MACGAPIAWYDNVPLVSWFLLRGRCRNCSAPISWRYPAVELATAGDRATDQHSGRATFMVYEN